MSTVAYGALTRRRKRSPSGTTRGTTKEAEQDYPPGLGIWTDTFAALVPGEVLVIHAWILPSYAQGTVITNADGLAKWFWVLLGLCIVFYAVGQIIDSGFRGFDGWDLLGIVATLAAFVAWMMVQTPSALDAVLDLSAPTKHSLVPIVGAVVGTLAALARAYYADQA